ncbi:Alanyl-tRNA synthetase [Clostridiaceae bacterium JG1575]|nr:Alanyl-tRNA synthetase [Clostridiaceae bacterium JG1575]
MNQPMTMNELRQSFLDFFSKKDHLVMESFPLVPKNDKSLLLVSAGMAPLKPYFTGQLTPPSPRVATCQKCIRTVDIENVGKTSRHLTFFEMLGNFSFGNYFKKEIIPWAWEYMTQVLKLPKDQLYATVYEDDDEAFEIWATETDIGEDRIFRLGKADNFWEIGVGPCGPCSEIHYDYGHAGPLTTREEFEEASEKDLTVEVWNLVFTQFNRDEEGIYHPLPNPNIDTGMGLERLATILQGVKNVFEIDTIRKILQQVEDVLGVTYGKEPLADVSLRIITDHVKSAAMLISDGVLPSNEGRGYILRRLLRRAARHGRVLGQREPFLASILPTVCQEYGVAYPLLLENQEYLMKIVALEEEKFNATLDGGMSVLQGMLEETKGSVFSGEFAFKLYDTYGFPLELTKELIEEKGLSLDEAEFTQRMNEQKKRARAARGESNYLGQEAHIINTLKTGHPYEFTGYDLGQDQGELLLLANEEGPVEQLEEGALGYAILSRAPFYAEMGGQVGDVGEIHGAHFCLKVLDTRKNTLGEVVNRIEVVQGTAVPGPVESSLVAERRLSIARNHTATHLLHRALKKVLGDHVQQAGSLVEADKLRFDFNHFSPLTVEELQAVEDEVNGQILAAQPVTTKVMSLEEAKACGAMALFEAKYGENVRVVCAGEESVELCGGTHVKNTGEIGSFLIVSETGIAAGIRRIEALTGRQSLLQCRREKQWLEEAAQLLKTAPKELTRRIRQMQSDLKEGEKERAALRSAHAQDEVSDLMARMETVHDVPVVRGVLAGKSPQELRDLTEKVLDRLDHGVCLLASRLPDKVAFCIMVSKDLAGTVHAGKLIGQVAKVAGGGGGGRPDMAQAGGKNPEKAQEAVDLLPTLL